jgi:hypothetical protein
MVFRLFQKVFLLSLLLVGFASVGLADFYVIPVTKNSYKGDWSNTGISYSKGDIVSHEGSSYICVNAHTSDTINFPPSENWKPMAIKGEDGAQGPQGATGAQGL